MDTLQNTILSILKMEKDAYEAEVKRLESENREDEAKLSKVRVNICGVVEALVRHAWCLAPSNGKAQKTKQATTISRVLETPQALIHADNEQDQVMRCTALFARMDSIADTWQTQLDLARQHHHYENEAVEEVKLDTMQKIKQKMQEALHAIVESQRAIVLPRQTRSEVQV